MPIEIQMLTCSVALLFVLIIIQAASGAMQIGLVKALGNREDAPSLTGFAGRAKRTVMNMLENMMMFAPLVLAGIAIQHTNQWSALGAQVFLYARVGHAATYLIGIPVIRALFYGAGLVGTGLVFYSFYV